MYYVMSKSYIAFHQEAICETLEIAQKIKRELSDSNNIDTFYIFKLKE